MNKRTLSLLLGLLLLASLTAVALAADYSWPDAEPSQNLTQNGDSYQSAIAVTQSEVAVAWAGEEDDRGIFLARLNRTTGDWNTVKFADSGNRNARFPELLYTNGVLTLAWVEHESTETRAPSRVQFQQVGAGAPTTVLGDLYGPIPRMAADTAGNIHMVFPAETVEYGAVADLYYTYRTAGGSWATPEIIVTQNQVIGGGSGGVWYPSVAVSPDGQNLYVAWEQHMGIVGGLPYRAIWYMEGIWNGSGVTWGAPRQLSAPETQLALRPDIVIDGAGRVHIIWARIQGYLAQPEGQYIEYLNTTDNVIRLVDAYPVGVNSIRPTLTLPRIDAYQSTICVAWHGYRLGTPAFEDVLLRCSSDAGQSWTVTVNTTESGADGALSLFPALALDGTGLVHLAWEEFQGGASYFTNYDILYRAGSAEIKVNTLYLPLIMRGR